MHVTLRTEHTT